MKKIRFTASRNYDLLIGRDLLKQVGQLTAGYLPPSRLLIITDDRVGALYAEIVRRSFEEAGFTVCSYQFPSGEGEKNTRRLIDILEYAAREQFTRSDVFVALGGGVAGDMAGLAAALFLRGVSYIQIPTTFLAAIDSSVGGKTAVNLSTGKNLMGAFWQPSLVLCDVDAFATLEQKVFSDGAAEAVKYGVIYDEALFASLENGLCAKAVPEDIIARCVELKRDVVREDEYDKGQRQLLNFGHTAGHAIERLSNYRITHGHAVATGMRIMTRAAERNGLCREPFSARLERALSQNGLSGLCDFSASELADAALSDKKRMGENVTIVIPERLGKCVLHTMPVSELQAFFEAGLSV